VYPDEMYLRFARCSPGPEKFNAKAAWKVMKNYDSRYLELTAASMEKQILSKVRNFDVLLGICFFLGKIKIQRSTWSTYLPD